MTANEPNARVPQYSQPNPVIETIAQIAVDTVGRKLAHLVASEVSAHGRTVGIDGQELRHFGSCSYLDLERHPALVEAVKTAVDAYGTQFSSSRAYLSIHQYDELEGLLAQIFERPAIACPSTSLGHLSALPVLIGDNDAIIQDQQVHHSVQTAAQLLKARGVPVHVVRHNRMDRLEPLVQKLESNHDNVWYLADGVYSMYGDVAPVDELVAMLNRNKRMWLYIDDAHGMGWVGKHGRGYVRSQIDHHERMVLAASLNKSFASSGGVLVFPDEELRRRVRNCGPSMIFSGPIQPPMLGAAIASARLHLSPEIGGYQETLKELIDYTNAGIAARGLPQVSVADTPLFFIPVGLPRTTHLLFERLFADGCYVNLGTFPAVPMKQGGIRFTIHRNLKCEDIDALLDSMAHHYLQVLKEEGSDLESVRATFRMVGLVVPEAKLPPLAESKESTSVGDLVVRHVSRIEELDAKRWDAVFAGRGAMTHKTLAMMESVFTAIEDPLDRAAPGYVWIEDKHGEPILATMYAAARIKDDMFARAEVSEKVEAVRRNGNADYLVSKAVVLGTPLSVGEHLALDRSHPQWEEALECLVGELHEAKKRENASQMLLRDFPAESHDDLEKKLLELGFFSLRLPDMMVLSELGWTDRDDYLRRLGQKYRYNVRREALAFEDHFDLEIHKACSPETIARCYELYRSVHARSYKMNVFALPFALFEAMFANPEYDILRLYLRKDDGTRDLAAVLISHHSHGHYSALLVGLHDDYLHSHGSYKQILFRCVERAHELGAGSLNLAFTADLEKKKLGARPRPTRAYVQFDDDYATTVMESL